MVCTAKRPQPGWLYTVTNHQSKFRAVAVNTKCRSFISLYSVLLYRGIKPWYTLFLCSVKSLNYIGDL